MTTAKVSVSNGIETTGFRSAFGFVSTTTIIGGSYVVLEAINHVVLFGYLQTWLISLGLSATMISVILYTLLVAIIGLMGYLAWKLYVSKRSVQ